MHSNKRLFTPFPFLLFISSFLVNSCYYETDISINSTSDNNIQEIIENNPAQNFKIISLGDSYTIGHSVCESCRFPEQLKDSLIANFDYQDSFELDIIAQTGWTTTNLISAIEYNSPSSDYDLVTLLIGVNNQYQGQPFSIYETEFIDLVEIASALAGQDSSKIIVISIPDYSYTPYAQNFAGGFISNQLDSYNNYAENYCNDNDISYVYITDITREGLENPDLVANDGLHLSSLAYTKFVERILPIAIQKLN